MSSRRLVIIAPTAKGNCTDALAEACLRDTITAVTQPILRADALLALGETNPPPATSPLETLHLTGDTLGERLATAFSVGFARGYQSVCLVFGDTPQLPEAFCIEAFGRLANSDAVMGPTDDGDVYLIGLRAPQPALFELLPGESCLETLLKNAADKQIAVSRLPPLYSVANDKNVRCLRTDLARNTSIAHATEKFLKWSSCLCL